MPARSIETEAALAKLARLLEVEPTEVDFLSYLPADALRDLRWEVSDRLNAADASRLAGVMAASKLVPIGLAATIGEKWFGPVLCARLVGLVDPKRGGQYASHLGVAFMADITARTDPRVVGDLVQELDVRTMQKIALQLLERDDYLTLSHFVGHLPPRVVAAILEAIDDNAAVVRIARYVEDLGHLDPVVALLPDERILDLVCAVEAADLWIDGLYLFSNLGDDQITRIATTIAQQDKGAVKAALGAFTRHDLWQQGIHLVDHLAPDDLGTLAIELLTLDDDVVNAAIAAISHIDAWATLLRIAIAVQGRGPEVGDRIRSALDVLLPADIVNLVRTVERDDLWVDGVRLFGMLSGAQMTKLATILLRQDRESVTAAIEAFNRYDLWTEALQLVDCLEPTDIAAFADVLLVLDETLIDTVVDVIDRTNAWNILVRIAIEVDELDERVRARLRALVERLPARQVASFEKAAATCSRPDLLNELSGSTSAQ